MHLTNPKASSDEKTKMEKISDNAEYLADKAQQKMQQTWNEVSPHIPDAASATASVLAKVVFYLVRFCPYSFSRPRCLPFIYYLCYFTPIMDADPLPGLHPLTMVGLGQPDVLPVFPSSSWGRWAESFIKARS